MRPLAPATEDDMIATFLCAEVRSSRFGARLLAALEGEGLGRGLIERPDTGDELANAARRRIFSAYRVPDSYSERKGLFDGFPDDVEWEWALAGRDELRHVRYIDWEFWTEQSAGTRLAAVAADRLRRRWLTDEECEVHRRIVAEVRAGVPMAELILVGRPGWDDLVVLEGHVRLTAYLLDLRSLPEEIPVLIGTSAKIADWSEYGL
jgi:hypothetical protein